VARFAIRVPSVDDLLDPYSAAPLEERPLQEDVRERILGAWIDTREERPSHLTVQLPAEEERDGLAERLERAIRHDLESTYEGSRRLRSRSRSQRRQTRIAFVFLVACLVVSGLIDRLAGGDPLIEGISQGFVVLGWVALWGPADRGFRAVARRLSRKDYRELAQVPIEVTWA
jgi:hypothetical protein